MSQTLADDVIDTIHTLEDIERAAKVDPRQVHNLERIGNLARICRERLEAALERPAS